VSIRYIRCGAAAAVGLVERGACDARIFLTLSASEPRRVLE